MHSVLPQKETPQPLQYILWEPNDFCSSFSMKWMFHSEKLLLWFGWSIHGNGSRDLHVKESAYVSLGCHNKIPQIRSLKTQKFVLSQFLRLGVWNQGTGQGHPLSLVSREESVSCLFLSSGCCQQSLAFLGCRCITQSLPSSSHGVLSLCLCFCKGKTLLCICPLHLHYTHSTTGHLMCMGLWGEGPKPSNSQILQTPAGCLTMNWILILSGDHIPQLRAQSHRLPPPTYFRCQVQVQVVTCASDWLAINPEVPTTPSSGLINLLE